MPQPIELGGNTYEYSFQLYQFDEITGDKELAEGLVAVAVWLSATDKGAAIHADVSEVAAERAGAPGSYWVRWEAEDLDAHVAPPKVFIVISYGGDIKRSVPVRVIP